MALLPERVPLRGGARALAVASHVDRITALAATSPAIQLVEAGKKKRSIELQTEACDDPKSIEIADLFLAVDDTLIATWRDNGVGRGRGVGVFGLDGTARGTSYLSPERTDEGSRSWEQPQRLAVAADASLVAIRTDEEVRLWRRETLARNGAADVVAKLPSYSKGLVFDRANKRLLVFVANPARLHAIDVETGQQTETQLGDSPHLVGELWGGHGVLIVGNAIFDDGGRRVGALPDDSIRFATTCADGTVIAAGGAFGSEQVWIVDGATAKVSASVQAPKTSRALGRPGSILVTARDRAAAIDPWPAPAA